MDKKKVLIIIGFIISILIIGLSVYKIIETSNKVNQDSNREVLNKNTKIKEDLKDNDENKKGEIKNNDNSENVFNNDEEDISVSDSTVSKLIEMVLGAYNSSCSSENNRDVFRKSDLVQADSIDMYTKLSLTADYIYKNESSRSNFVYTKNVSSDSRICGLSYISEEDIKKVYFEIFGKDAKYERSSFDVNWDTYNWSNENNRYESQVLCGKGGTCPGGSTSKVAYAKKTNNEIHIYEYYAYVDMNTYPDPYNIYADYNKTNLIISETTNAYEDEFFKKYSDKLGLYKYIFKYDSNNKNYYFYSVEKVK